MTRPRRLAYAVNFAFLAGELTMTPSFAADPVKARTDLKQIRFEPQVHESAM